jgi:hypothetical protein
VISQFLAAAAAVGLMGAGFANASQTRSFEAMTGQTAMFGGGEGGGAEGGTCRVDVVRSGSAGSADITRQTFSDGSCVCMITTGPAGNNGSAEAAVTNLLRDRECAGAPVAGAAGGQAAGAAAGGGGMGGGAVIGVLFGVAALGVGVAAGGGKKDSAG